MNSSSDDQEVDQPDQQNNKIGIGRSYECVFCKRGFNTAQALGGHMNIHRRDRAKNRPAMINSFGKEETNVSTIYFPQISSCPPRDFLNQDAYINYDSFVQDDSTSNQRPLLAHHAYGSCDQIPPIINKPLNLSLQFEGEDRKEKRVIDTQREELELDLELRLGNKS